MSEAAQVVSYQKPSLDAVGAAQHRASLIEISDQSSFELATDLAREFKARRDAIEAKRVEYVTPLNTLKDKIQGDFVPVIADYDAGIKVLKGSMATYVSAQQRIQAEAQAAADKAARDAAEAAEKAAKKAEKKGDTEGAEAIRELAAVTPSVVVAARVEQVAGTSMREKWNAEVVDLFALVKFVSMNPEYIHLVDASPSAIRKQAELQKGAMNIPGLKAVKTSIVALRS